MFATKFEGTTTSAVLMSVIMGIRDECYYYCCFNGSTGESQSNCCSDEASDPATESDHTTTNTVLSTNVYRI